VTACSLLSSHNMPYCILDELDDDYGYDYHGYYYIYLNCLDDACFMRVIVYRYKPNSWLN
jgi:hypothetical protein